MIHIKSLLLQSLNEMVNYRISEGRFGCLAGFLTVAGGEVRFFSDPGTEIRKNK
jgi:hypothetical protein